MDNITLLVLADPTEPRLAMLEELPPETGIAVGNSAEAFVRAAPDATVIFNWSLAADLQPRCFACARTSSGCTRARPGWDGLLLSGAGGKPVGSPTGAAFTASRWANSWRRDSLFREGSAPHDPQPRRPASGSRSTSWKRAARRWGSWDMATSAAPWPPRARLGMRVLGMKRHGPPAA